MAPGVPGWVTILAVFIAAFGTIVGLVALIDPMAIPFSDADEALGRGWAGRNLGIAFVTGAAVALRSRPMYVVALIAGLARELGDLAAAITDGESVAPAVVFIVIGLGALLSIWRASLRVGPVDEERAVQT
jgi:hypothetical protein